MSKHRRSPKRQHFSKGDRVVAWTGIGTVLKVQVKPPRREFFVNNFSPYHRFGSLSRTRVRVRWDGPHGRDIWISADRLRHARLPGDRMAS